MCALSVVSHTFSVDGAAFRSIVLHELSYLRDHNIDKKWLYIMYDQRDIHENITSFCGHAD